MNADILTTKVADGIAVITLGTRGHAVRRLRAYARDERCAQS
jgi:hypothetical protein